MDEGAGNRERILAAARRLLEAGEVPTADAVAATAGVSRSTYYRLIGGSHEALLREAGYIAEPSARDRVLDAAAALMDEVGITGLLMDAVAERAGVSRATLYRLFPGKTELLGELARARISTSVLGSVLALAADRPPAEVLPALLTASVPRLLASRGMLRAILAEASLSSPEAVTGRAVLVEFFAALAGYLERHMEAGRLRRIDPVTALQALLGPLLLYLVVRPAFWEEVGEPVPPDQTVAEFVKIWLRGMAPEPPAE